MGARRGMRRAQSMGGAVLVQTTSMATFSDTVFAGNSVFTNGGAIFCSLSDSVVEFYGQSELHSNAAEQGAAIYIAPECSVSVHSGARIHHNVAAKEGGGIYLQSNSGGVVNISKLVAEDIDVDSNEALQFGGGGISCGERSQIALSDVRLSSNTASSGGGLYASGCEVLLERSSLRANEAATGEGSAALLREYADVRVTDSEVTNHGLAEGEKSTVIIDVQRSNLQVTGNLQISGNRVEGELMRVWLNSSVSISTSIFEENECLSSVSITDSLLNLSDTNFISNIGSSVLCDENADVHLSHCTFTNNNALSTLDELGAGVRSSLGSNLQVDNCLFEGNQAVQGSAMYIRGNLVAAGCTFRHNQATDRGTLSAELSVNQSVVLDNCSFVGNAAHDGAGVYLTTAPAGSALPDAASLTNLLFEQNNATGGGSIGFWDTWDLHSPNPSPPPECVQCTILNNTASYDSSSGWATTVTEIRAESDYGEVPGGKQLFDDNAIRVTLVDLFGQVVTTANGVMAMTTACSTRGLDDALVQEGAAQFEGLEFQESPLTTCSMNISAYEYTDVPTVISVISIRECYEGEFYNEGGTECIMCDAGELAFGTSITSCLDCNAYNGITCYGGSAYTILDGYWLPPVASTCDNAECLVEKLYACAVSEACATNDTVKRSGDGAEGVATLELCALDKGYTSGVVCGGSEQVVCAQDYYSSVEGIECMKCPSAGAVLFGFLTFGGLIILLLLAVMLLFVRSSANADVDSFLQSAQDMMDANDTMSDMQEIMSAGRIFSALLGYMQVIGQLGTIYDKASLPFEMSEFTSKLFVFNLNINVILNTRCLMHHFVAHSDEQATSTFWAAFYQALLTPWAVVLFFFLMYGVYRRHLYRNNCPEVAKRRSDSAYYRVCAATFFFLTLMHASVSTSVMHLFNCQKFYYEEESTQEWVQQDTSIECYTKSWWGAVAMAVSTIVIYLIGYPVGIFLYMWWARRYLKCRISIADFKSNRSWLENISILPRELDVDRKRVFLSFKRVLHGGDTDVVDIYILRSVVVPLDRTEKARVEEGTEGVAPDQADNKQLGEGTEGVAPDQADNKQLGEGTEGVATDQADETQLKEVVICSKVDRDLDSEGSESPQYAAHSPQSPSGRPVWRFENTEYEEEAVGDEEERLEMALTKIANTSRRVYGHNECCVRLYEKKDVGDAGLESWVPVTWTDSEDVRKVLGGAFLAPFEDYFYFWQCYEILRRMLQTGVVLLFELYTGIRTALSYALLISMIAVAIHLRFRPFVDDRDDSLMGAILVNQALVQFMIMYAYLTSSPNSSLGYLMVGCQIAVVSYAAYLLIPATRALFHATKESPVMKKAITKVKVLRQRLSRKEQSAVPVEKDTDTAREMQHSSFAVI
ncbi:hypothetical protein CYMTET_16840 [Cymbomonas tetramitiformis]|uniref:Right handed beta helix domain-containing protein n=1 Tax=Cymbomonas tetramitiformis TaxID=36881 RepID=A0AAE0L7R4_9CHLO|nr:hypothetical protein CYMTET_16840 [Cymbomonas tetramitiformis]